MFPFYLHKNINFFLGFCVFQRFFCALQLIYLLFFMPVVGFANLSNSVVYITVWCKKTVRIVVDKIKYNFLMFFFDQFGKFGLKSF